MDPVQAVAFLVAANVGSSYGNSIPAILIGVPGTSSAVLTAVDGYELHRKGQTGLALGVQYYGAMFGTLTGIPLFLLMVVPLAHLTYVFLAPEMFALFFLGMTAVMSHEREPSEGVLVCHHRLRPQHGRTGSGRRTVPLRLHLRDALWPLR
jgi:putative tricarboxylic transport membrane protein